MAFKISITAEAERQFRALPARERRILNKLIVEGEEFHGHQDDPT
jgi:mRNA-degrading endonuclease RelE of RelBE toxin-antitoxin system